MSGFSSSHSIPCGSALYIIVMILCILFMLLYSLYISLYYTISSRPFLFSLIVHQIFRAYKAEKLWAPQKKVALSKKKWGARIKSARSHSFPWLRSFTSVHFPSTVIACLGLVIVSLGLRIYFAWIQINYLDGEE